jgi:hypothetical protein
MKAFVIALLLASCPLAHSQDKPAAPSPYKIRPTTVQELQEMQTPALGPLVMEEHPAEQDGEKAVTKVVSMPILTQEQIYHLRAIRAEAVEKLEKMQVLQAEVQALQAEMQTLISEMEAQHPGYMWDGDKLVPKAADKPK